MSNRIQQLLDTARERSPEERLQLLTEITQSFAASLNVEEALRTSLLRTGDGLFDEQDRTLMHALASSAALAIHNAHMADGLVEQERLRKQLDLALEIQLDLLPRAAARDFSIQAVNLPAQAVSGDFYDFLQLPDGRIYFNLADVSGKGMNATLLMARASSLLHHLARAETDPDRLLATVNDAICESSLRGMFITIVSGYLNPGDGSVTFANAGHLPPLFHDADGMFHEFPASVPPLGMLPDSNFPVQTLPLQDGCLYLYTDGVTEAEDATGRALESAGLQETIRAHAGEPLSQCLQAITEAIMHGRRQRDDVTLMLVGCP